MIHWQLCKEHNLEHNEKWYDHRPKTVVENKHIKLLWDMRLKTDKELDHSKPDIVILDKESRL